MVAHINKGELAEAQAEARTGRAAAAEDRVWLGWFAAAEAAAVFLSRQHYRSIELAVEAAELVLSARAADGGFKCPSSAAAADLKAVAASSATAAGLDAGATATAGPVCTAVGATPGGGGGEQGQRPTTARPAWAYEYAARSAVGLAIAALAGAGEWDTIEALLDDMGSRERRIGMISSRKYPGPRAMVGFIDEVHKRMKARKSNGGKLGNALKTRGT